jgi:hypothetical protein
MIVNTGLDADEAVRSYYTLGVTAVTLGRPPRMADGNPGSPLRAVRVDATEANAARFYLKWGFQPSLNDPLRLFISMKDLAKSLGIK